ncbi:hypothetical protein ONZ51_g3766 [Trametes cubensis]|uniref:Uncharacterized protein n=1 Tax=Trametes cubensis TaxID=1111947 RepID=A0AAD7XCQ7_9APHY|nr:hypothetical protein ONZ51_g3766 [Trametes cubensis]
MSPAADRPRRSKANVHPAEPLLMLKVLHRSSAEAAQERAAVEAQRQEISKRDEEDMKALAELEAQLKVQDEAAEKYAMRPPAQQRLPDHAHIQFSAGSQMSVAVAEPDEQGQTKSEQSKTPNKKVSGGRLKKSTCADFEVFRDALNSGSGMRTASKENHEPGGLDTLKAATPEVRKRKAAEAGVNSEDAKATQSSRPTPAKKGKPTIPGGLTAAAAARLASSASSTLPAITTAQGNTGSTSDSTPASKVQSVTHSADSGNCIENETDEPLEADRQELFLLPSKSQKPSEERQTSQGIVQVTPDPGHHYTTSSGRDGHARTGVPLGLHPVFAMKKTSSNWQMKDLEPVLGLFIGRFNLQFIPKLINCVGNQASGPWRLYGMDLGRIMTDIGKGVWPELADGFRVEPRDAFYELVEHALRMWESGEYRPPKPRTEEGKFSDKLWGGTAQEYLGHIIILSDEQWDKILQLAEKHLRGLVHDSDDDRLDDSDDSEAEYHPSELPTTGARAQWETESDED